MTASIVTVAVSLLLLQLAAAAGNVCQQNMDNPCLQIFPKGASSCKETFNRNPNSTSGYYWMNSSWYLAVSRRRMAKSSKRSRSKGNSLPPTRQFDFTMVDGNFEDLQRGFVPKETNADMKKCVKLFKD